jgi:hypothetical protein
MLGTHPKTVWRLSSFFLTANWMHFDCLAKEKVSFSKGEGKQLAKEKASNTPK